MSRNQLTVCYITEDQGAVASLSHTLKAAFPKVSASTAASIDEALSRKDTDLIIADDSFKNISTTIPVLRVIPESDIIQYVAQKEDFVTYAELETHALVRAVRSLLEKNRLASELKDAVVRDERTGLFNQRYLVESLNKEAKKAIRYGYPLTALYMGIDGLKKINAKYGPEAGDQAIVDFGLILSNSLRCVDTVGRYSGDEFMAILPETSLANSIKACERIQSATKKFAFANTDSDLTLSASIGIASLSHEIRTGEELLRAARLALSGAKQRGSGSFCTFEEAREIDEPTKENRELISALQQQIQMLTEDAKKSHLAGILKTLNDLSFYKKLVSHHEHVAFYAERLASKLSVPPEDLAIIRNSALLHDIGKLAIDERIITKNGALSSTEYAIVKQHPLFAAQMLAGSVFLKNEANIILHHHEHFDGNGYPDHMNGNRIPLASRIITLAEAWDTMITAQNYRNAMALDQALTELKAQSGKQFDPELVAIFTGLIEN